MQEVTYAVEGMDCANCAHDLEKGVATLEGVQSVFVDFFGKKMIVVGDITPQTLQNRSKALGFTLEELPSRSSVRNAATLAPQGALRFWGYLLRQRNTRLALIGGGLILLALLASLLGVEAEIVDLGYIAALLVALYPIGRSGLNNLWINRDFNINLLMTIAAVGALLIGEYLEGATVIFLFAVGEALEGYTTERARNSLRSLMTLSPAQAVLVIDDREMVVPVETLQVNDVIRVKPAERIAMDGVVLAGESSVNQAPITGESLPVVKAVGAEVFAGSVNGEGALTVRVTRLAADNTLSRIIQLVEAAQGKRAPSQRIIDQFARYYTPAVAGIALVMALVPPLLFGAPFWDTTAEHGWFYRALTLLVIACPCALVISTPVTVISAITAGARRGVLIKGGAYLEALANIRVFAFDKTGTLTQGEPQVQQVRAASCAMGERCVECDAVLELASAVEHSSSHPIARAVLRYAQAQGIGYAAAEHVTTLSGRGVQGSVDGQRVIVGSHPYFDTQYPHSPTLCALVKQAEGNGETTMLVAKNDEVQGYISVADSVREDSRAVIAELKTMRLHTVLLTGDNATAAASVGRQVGIDEVRAHLLPEDKVSAVHELMGQFGQVAMVGDGINDTPALAAATVGIAMGGAGTDQALETADIALMADDLRGLPFAVRLARFTRRIIRLNIVISLATKAIFLLLAPFGGVSLWAAILVDVGVSLLVTLNGMRPLRFEQRPVSS